MYKVIGKITEMAQRYAAGVVMSKDIVVDATLGNGWDTLFLSDLAAEGRVYSFEIQRRAVESFRDILKSRNINNVELINDGHQNMDLYIKDRPRVIMFNLGYLPGGEEGITTTSSTTLQAIEKGLKMLLPGGIITICVYRGHEEGGEESRALREYLGGLDPRHFSSIALNYINRSSNSPYLIVVEKNDSVHEDI